MKTLVRRSISIIMSVIMILSCFAGMTFSVGAETSGDYEYRVLSDGTAAITKYNGNEKNVNIPSEIDGYSVIMVYAYAFKDCKTIKNIEISDSITAIGLGSFSNCSSLESIKLP